MRADRLCGVRKPDRPARLRPGRHSPRRQSLRPPAGKPWAFGIGKLVGGNELYLGPHRSLSLLAQPRSSRPWRSRTSTAEGSKSFPWALLAEPHFAAAFQRERVGFVPFQLQFSSNVRTSRPTMRSLESTVHPIVQSNQPAAIFWRPSRSGHVGDASANRPSSSSIKESLWANTAPPWAANSRSRFQVDSR